MMKGKPSTLSPPVADALKRVGGKPQAAVPATAPVEPRPAASIKDAGR